MSTHSHSHNHDHGHDHDNEHHHAHIQTAVLQQAPDFAAQAYHNGDIKNFKLSEHKGKWVVLFFYPLDFTFVCPTEIIAFSDKIKEFQAIGAEVLGVSVDS